MDLNWYFYSDTNARADELEALLMKKSHTLKSFHLLEDLFHQLERMPHTILFLKANTAYNVYDLCQEISVKFPSTYLVIIVPENMENTKKAMRVGASNMLTYSSDSEEINEVIIQAQSFVKQRANQKGSAHPHLQKKNSRVMAVCSSKGGVGKTTLSVNLANAFVKDGKSVVILDANFQFGDVSMYVDLKPKRSVYEWVKEGVERERYGIENYLTHHSSGVAILATPPRPEFFEIITEDHLELAVSELRKSYDVILIDTPTYISEIHLKSLMLCDDILLVTTGDLPVLRNTKLYLDMLESLQLNEKVKIILNRDSKHRVIEVKRMESILQEPVYVSLPDQGVHIATTINEGLPLVMKNGRNAFSKGMFILAHQLIPVSSEVEKKPKRFALSR
ncbi:AAA family ATPase [Alkalihalobacillus hwajinpoensis]|uniref:AAA family ATPase n=1 Tax=Guptibacillus hwajinpoensis TaxID=208199 RepID=UPI001883383C|nr:AAA family ATPase [Pseudalkalibacillus hwajinpoensis]MBF0707918.1 AAA family ATPase [Pseudalkalibacillus hwajinpoensis]